MNKFILVLFLGTTSAFAGLSKIDALGMIESGNNDAAIGSSGEVSRYQIKPYIWREYSSSRSWRDVRVAAHVAQDYLSDLEGSFRKHARREPTDFDLYVLWNAGPAYYSKVGYAPARVHHVIRERARRFANLREMHTISGTPAVPPTVPAIAAPPAPPLAQFLSAPLPALDSNALNPALSGVVLMPLEPRPVPADRPAFSFLSTVGTRTR